METSCRCWKQQRESCIKSKHHQPQSNSMIELWYFNRNQTPLLTSLASLHFFQTLLFCMLDDTHSSFSKVQRKCSIPLYLHQDTRSATSEEARSEDTLEISIIWNSLLKHFLPLSNFPCWLLAVGKQTKKHLTSDINQSEKMGRLGSCLALISDYPAWRSMKRQAAGQRDAAARVKGKILLWFYSLRMF